MANDDKKSTAWKKVLKLFVEFLIAAGTALVTTLSGQAMNLW